MLRALVAERMDPVLFGYSYDYVGDLAETVSLVWPDPNRSADHVPTLGEVVEKLQSASRSDGPGVLADLLDNAGISARFAIIKLVTGGLRIGVSARLAKQALAQFGKVDVTEIEELWHGLTPPYATLFAWLEGKAPKPKQSPAAPFRPVMLSHPVEDNDLAKLEPADYVAEWKWDGIRVQALSRGGVSAALFAHRRRYFPRLSRSRRLHGLRRHARRRIVGRHAAAMDRHLLRPAATAQPQGCLGQRCANVSRHSCALRLSSNRERGFAASALCRAKAASGGFRQPAGAVTLRSLADRPLPSWEELEALRKAPPHPIIEGVMLKRRDSAYVAGRPKGPWFKWKRDPHTIDAVLMYAQRGHGKRSSYYSDYTFGVWSGPPEASELVPVGKAYFGFTDEELKQIDTYVRDNTVERFGPVRSVRADAKHGLVLEVAFEGLNRSTRHKSGVAMRFPSISRLRWDKPAHEADRLETLTAMLD